MKIYGPYTCFDGRIRIVLVDKFGTTTMSYPKYLMEQHLGRKLLDNEEVHHIDENPQNNDLDNLEVRTGTNHRKHHASLFVEKSELFVCPQCDKLIELVGRKLSTYKASARNRGSAGPFCSRRCAGRYGQQFGPTAKIV